MMAANLQIFMTNTASHCKGMWNLCVISALKKNNLFRVDAARTYVRFNRKSHGSDVHPDLNMSFKTCNAKGKSVWGKSLDFLQFQHRGAGWSTFVF